jgi:transketolase
MKNACLESLIELGEFDERVVFISVDQPTGMDDEFIKKLKDRFFFESISEANVIGLASGLASEGLIPYIFNHATFSTRRCYEQIFLDACLQNRSIRLIAMGAGLATSHLGPTHTSLDDISLMRSIPGMTVFVPADAHEVRSIMPQTLDWDESIYIRLCKYGVPKYGESLNYKKLAKPELGKALILNEGNVKNEILFVSTGAMSPICLEVAKNLKKISLSTKVMHVSCIKPLDEEMIVEESKKVKRVYFVEEHSSNGGLGTACIEALVKLLKPSNLPIMKKICLPDEFIHKYGDQKSVFKLFKLLPDQITSKVILDVEEIS